MMFTPARASASAEASPKPLEAPRISAHPSSGGEVGPRGRSSPCLSTTGLRLGERAFSAAPAVFSSGASAAGATGSARRPCLGRSVRFRASAPASDRCAPFLPGLGRDVGERELRRAEVRHTAGSGQHQRHDPAVLAARMRDPLGLAAVAETTGDAAAESRQLLALGRGHGRQPIGVVVLPKSSDPAGFAGEDQAKRRTNQRPPEQEDGLEARRHDSPR